MWLGLWQYVGAATIALIAIGLGVWAHVRGLSGPNIALIVIASFFLITFSGAFLINLLAERTLPPKDTTSTATDSPITFLPSEEHPLSEFNKFAPAFSVVVACLRNNETPQIQSTEFAAHVVYEDANGKEVADLRRAVWLGSSSSTSIRFPIGIARKLAIFFAKGGKLEKPVARFLREQIPGQIVSIPDFQSEPFSTAIAHIKISLISLPPMRDRLGLSPQLSKQKMGKRNL